MRLSFTFQKWEQEAKNKNPILSFEFAPMSRNSRARSPCSNFFVTIGLPRSVAGLPKSWNRYYHKRYSRKNWIRIFIACNFLPWARGPCAWRKPFRVHAWSHWVNLWLEWRTTNLPNIVARHGLFFQNNSLREDFLVKTDDEVRRCITQAFQKIGKDPIQGKRTYTKRICYFLVIF